MNSRDKQLLDFVQSAKSAVQLNVSRKVFSTPIPGGEFGEDWERKARGLAYDVAKGMAVAAKAPQPGQVFNVTLPHGNEEVRMNLAPGMGAYTQVGSDRYPYTLIGYTTNGLNLFVQQDFFTRTDTNGQSENQEYRFGTNPNAVPEKAIWSPKYGHHYLRSNIILYLGTRRAYQDPGF